MPAKKLQQCPLGHRFYKSSSCPVCPVCEQTNKPSESFLSLLSAPARRALQNNKIDTLQKLSAFSEKEILQLHGIGKASLPILIKLMSNQGLTFSN